MNCADRAQPYPTPFPTAPNHTTPYNPLQPSQPPHYNTTLCHPHSTHTPHSTVHPIPLQRENSFLEDESLLSNAVCCAYSQKCQNQASFCSFAVLAICLLWSYSSAFKITLLIFIDSTYEDSLHLIWRAARPWSPEMSTPGQHSCPSPF